MLAEHFLASLFLKVYSCRTRREERDEQILVYFLYYDTTENKLYLSIVEFYQYSFNIVTLNVFAAVVD